MTSAPASLPSLSIFATDLYDVVVGRARPIYQDPGQFFALTYPTFNLRELVKDVLQRRAGKNEKAVRQGRLVVQMASEELVELEAERQV